MLIQPIIERMRKDFTYASDQKTSGTREKWSFLAKSGKVEGDCEDYCLTMIRRIYGSIFMSLFAIATRKVSIHYCHLYSGGKNRGGHAVLRLPNGRYIECNEQKQVCKKQLIGQTKGFECINFKRFTFNQVMMKLAGKYQYLTALFLIIMLPLFLIALL